MADAEERPTGFRESAFSRPKPSHAGAYMSQSSGPGHEDHREQSVKGKDRGRAADPVPGQSDYEYSAPKQNTGSPAASLDGDPDKSAGDLDRPGLGRAYVPWNSEEEECLRLGVVRHGVGAWQIILRDPSFSLLKKRTGIQLKDKWRNLVKFNHLSREETVLAATTTKRKGGKRALNPKGGEAVPSPTKKAKGAGKTEAATRPPSGLSKPVASVEIPRDAMASLLNLRAQAQASSGVQHPYHPIGGYQSHRQADMEGDARSKGLSAFEAPSSRVMAADQLAANGLRTAPLDVGPQAKTLNFRAMQSRRRSWAGEHMTEAQEMQRFEDMRREQEHQLLKGMQGAGYGAGTSHGSDEDKDERDWVKARRHPDDRPAARSAVHEWQLEAQWKEMQMAGLIELRMILAESLQIQSEADNSLLETVSRCRDGTRSQQQLQEAIKLCEIANDKVQLTYRLMDAWRERICSDASSDSHGRYHPFPPR